MSVTAVGCRIPGLRGFLVIAALACVAACAPMTAKPGPAVMIPHVAEDSFVASDGTALPTRRWLPEDGTKPRAVVLAAHGFNDYSNAFGPVPGVPGVGPYLAAKGIAVYAYDQRGFGRTPEPGVWPGDQALVSDFTTFAKQLRKRYPGVPLYGLGESMGGAVVMTALAGPNPPPLNGAILMAPAVWARSTMPMFYRVALWFGAHVLPGLKPTGKSLGRQASNNVPMLRTLGHDPYFIKKTRIDAVYGLVNLMDDALRAAPHEHLPILYLTGGRDEIIPPKATAEAMEHLLATDPKARGAFYDDSWHMMARDVQGATVLADIAAYVDDAAKPLPSGADQDALARLQERAKKPWVLHDKAK